MCAWVKRVAAFWLLKIWKSTLECAEKNRGKTIGCNLFRSSLNDMGVVVWTKAQTMTKDSCCLGHMSQTKTN